MRKFSIMAITIALVLGAILAPVAGAARKAKKVKTTRTETADYTTSGSAAAPIGVATVCAQSQGCLTFVAQSKEEYVTFTVTDATGTPAPFLVSLDGATTSTYCGATDRPVWLNRATEIEVLIATVAVPDCPGVATSGSLSATFSNLP